MMKLGLRPPPALAFHIPERSGFPSAVRGVAALCGADLASWFVASCGVPDCATTDTASSPMATKPTPLAKLRLIGLASCRAVHPHLLVVLRISNPNLHRVTVRKGDLLQIR